MAEGEAVAAEGDRSRAHALTLAAELRGISEALAVDRPGDEALVEAIALARTLREQLRGPRGLRWYDGEPSRASSSAVSRRAYLDQSPVRGELNPIAPPLHVELGERDDGTPVVRGWARLGYAYEGPPHGVHGGWVAALFDDLLGAAQGLTGRSGVTGTLDIKYRRITPIERDLSFEAWIERERGRRLIVRGTCRAGDVLTAEARAMFVRVDFATLV